MSTQRLKRWLLCSILGLSGGCASLPPAPDTVGAPPPGARSGSSLSPPNGPSGVIPASDNQPIKDTEKDKDKKEDKGFELSDLSPANMYKGLRKAVGLGPDEKLAQKYLEEGKALFQEGVALRGQQKSAEAAEKFKLSADQFKSAAGRWPDSVLEEDALFLRAESLFFSDQYPKADDTFSNLLKKHKNSRYLDTIVKRQFALGQYWEKLDDKHRQWPVTPNVTDNSRPLFDTFGNAIKCYDSVRLNDPSGPLADDALMATASAYFVRGRWEDAAYHYDLLRKDYPNSEFQQKAHVLGLQAKLRVYQGASYDGVPLQEAKQIADQTLTQFGRELGPERASVAETRKKIAEQEAERDWAMARFYEKKNAFGAARYYYQNLVREYPLSEHAQMARQRLEEIRNEPDNPPNRFKFLTDLFPEGK